VLLNASPRKDVRGGDLYLVWTEIGTYVLIRSQKATGSTPEEGTARSCEDYTSDNYPYTAIPPGLLRMWFSISRWQLAWPVVDRSSEAAAGGYVFVGADSGTAIARAECETATYCTASFMGRTLATPSAAGASLEAVLRVVRSG
jgi:hypothetical protein